MSQRLMLVDNSPAVHRLVEQASQAEGFETEWFKDGAAALDAAAQGVPAVIVAGYDAVGTTFISFCERLAGLELQPSPPIIALISPSDKFDEAELRFLGVKAFLQKPLRRNDVLQAVKDIASTLGSQPAVKAAAKPASAPATAQAASEAPPAPPQALTVAVASEVQRQLEDIVRRLLPEQIGKAYPREDMILIAMEAVQQAIPDIAAQLVADVKPLVQRQVAEITERLVKESLEAGRRPGS